MNIGIGKFGKSILFDSKKWGAIGGDLDAPVLISLMATRNPQNKYYLLGHSDYSRLKPELKNAVTPHDNIIDCWVGHKGEPYTNVLLEWFKSHNIKLDIAILHCGPTGNSNIPDLIKSIKGDRVTKTLFCFRKYAGPIVHLLNTTNLPYFTISVDSRYTPFRARDLFNHPKFSMSQINGYNQKKYKHIKSYDDHTIELVGYDHYYSGIETLFLTMKKKPTWEEFSKPKDKGFVVVLNEGGNGAWCRGPLLKQYVLDSFPDVEVYGQWSTLWNLDKRFKGPKKFMDLEDTLKGTKYTFIIPIAKDWVTAKFWEMIHYGIIPFFHPTYDTQKNIKCPDFIRVKDPQDLVDKIKFLDSHKDDYFALLAELYNMLEEKYYDGNFISESINLNVDRLLKEVK